MKRRVLLVDDEVAVLLTLKAVLEINGFEVETAASAREGRLKLRSHEFDMVITDMRMESDQAGAEVIMAARTASFNPAIALLTAFPVAEEDWQEMGAHHMLVKPMHTRILLEQIDKLLQARDKRIAVSAPKAVKTTTTSKTPTKKVVLVPAKLRTVAIKKKSTKKTSAARKPKKASRAAAIASKSRSAKNS